MFNDIIEARNCSQIIFAISLISAVTKVKAAGAGNSVSWLHNEDYSKLD